MSDFDVGGIKPNSVFIDENSLSLLEYIRKFRVKEKRSSSPDYSITPPVWYHRTIEICRIKLNECSRLVRRGKPSPYAETTGLPKCNLFLNDVLKEANIPVPWDTEHPLAMHGMNQALASDPRYEKVWSRSASERDWPADNQRFINSFKPHDSDILIWDNRYLQHIAIAEESIDGHGNIYYAGRDTLSGLGYSNLRSAWIESRVIGYGAPDVIYSYKYLFR